jgi:ribosomal protein L11 methyltransferase
MSWIALDVRTTPERRGALADWLVARTGQAIEERPDGTLVSFAESADTADHLSAEIIAEGGDGTSVAQRVLDEVDWTLKWRDGLEAHRFGRLVVTPSWLTPPTAPGDRVMVLDPENAFGSGAHGSTRAVLALLERHVHGGELVLDLGAGSGILAIAARMLGAARAVGVETDGDAIPVAEHNAARNGIADGISFLEGDAGALAPLLGPAQLVCSNILRSVNTQILPAIAEALAPGGLCLFSGMETAEEAPFRETLAASGWSVVDTQVDTAWWACAAAPPARA